MDQFRQCISGTRPQCCQALCEYRETPSLRAFYNERSVSTVRQFLTRLLVQMRCIASAIDAPMITSGHAVPAPDCKAAESLYSRELPLLA